MGLLDRFRSKTDVAVRDSSIDQWLEQYLIPAVGTQFTYGGVTYTTGGGSSPVIQSMPGTIVQQFAASLPGHSTALKASPPAFAAQMVRALVLSQARFVFRNMPYAARNPRKVFGTSALGLLERPWPNGTTGDLIGRMEWHAGVAGNAFVTNWKPGRLTVLRPDWVVKVYGSELEPDDAATAIDAELVGYAYCNGGITSGNRIIPLSPAQVAHWYPMPDPEYPEIGMSWVTPAIQEIRGDLAATQHKLKFFENGATPNLVISGIPATTAEQFGQLVDKMEDTHAGLRNAYKTLYLTMGADAKVVGADLRQIDFAATQGKSETRLSILSRVPASLLGISEGLAGSSLNAGNFAAARRSFGDSWIFPTLANLCASLGSLVNVPAGAELWFDTSDVPVLREDAKDAAEITQVQASTIVALTNAGWEPDAAVAAVLGMDLTALNGRHSGLLSVQLQEPGAQASGAPGAPSDTTGAPQ